MPTIGKIVQITAVAAIAVAGVIGGKWYYTAALETIDPQQGIYGMAGLELWIDLNARMPGFARDWGCQTLRSGKRLPSAAEQPCPHSCPTRLRHVPTARVRHRRTAKTRAGRRRAGRQPDRRARACFDGKMPNPSPPRPSRRSTPMRPARDDQGDPRHCRSRAHLQAAQP